MNEILYKIGNLQGQIDGIIKILGESHPKLQQRTELSNAAFVALTLFRNKPLTYSEFCVDYALARNVSIEGAKAAFRNLKTRGLITRQNNGKAYRLTPKGGTEIRDREARQWN